MPSVPQGDYQSIGGAMDGRTVSGSKFFVKVAGSTNDSHIPIVSHIKKMGYVQVTSSASCDFILLIIPVVSRVGTDIDEALQNVDRDKEKVLVVMHHTFNPNTAIAESRRQVEDPKVLLTVDCLFYERELLNCDLNNIAWDQICRSLGIPSPQESFPKNCLNWCGRHKWIVGIVVAGVCVTVVVLGSVFGRAEINTNTTVFNYNNY